MITLFTLLFALLFQLAPAPVFADTLPDAVIYTTRERIYAAHGVNLDTLTGTPVYWSPETGFQWPETGYAVGWLTLVYADDFVYAQVIKGARSGDYYLLTTDDFTAFIADYGGANTWHSDGAYRLTADTFEALIARLTK